MPGTAVAPNTPAGNHLLTLSSGEFKHAILELVDNPMMATMVWNSMDAHAQTLFTSKVNHMKGWHGGKKLHGPEIFAKFNAARDTARHMVSLSVPTSMPTHPHDRFSFWLSSPMKFDKVKATLSAADQAAVDLDVRAQQIDMLKQLSSHRKPLNEGEGWSLAKGALLVAGVVGGSIAAGSIGGAVVTAASLVFLAEGGAWGVGWALGRKVPDKYRPMFVTGRALKSAGAGLVVSIKVVTKQTVDANNRRRLSNKGLGK